MFNFFYTRLKLAAIHYNSNADRDLGKKRKLLVYFPKFKKGEATVKALSSAADYSKLIPICQDQKVTKNVDDFTTLNM